MTKISSPSFFDEASIANTNSYKDLKPFIDYANNFFQNIIQVLQSGTSLGDNLDVELLTLTTAGGSTKIKVARLPVAIFVGRQIPVTPALTSITWQPTNTNEIEVTVTFSVTPTNPLAVTLIAFHS